jgi:hypothetical protein
MKKSMLLVIFVGLVLLIAASPAFTAAAKPSAKPFVGAWEAIDVDGSYMKLNIGGGTGNQYNLHLIDFGASVCGKDANGQPIYAFQAKGNGTAVGNHMDISFTNAYCMKSPKEPYGDFASWLDYDPASETMWDGWVTWKRMGAK